MIWLFSVPILLTFPWVLWRVRRLSVAWTDRESFRRHRDQAYLAMGCFQLSIASVLIGFGLRFHSSAWINAITLSLVGIGFIVLSQWHPFEGLDE